MKRKQSRQARNRETHEIIEWAASALSKKGALKETREILRGIYNLGVTDGRLEMTQILIKAGAI